MVNNFGGELIDDGLKSLIGKVPDTCAHCTQYMTWTEGAIPLTQKPPRAIDQILIDRTKVSKLPDPDEFRK